MSGWNDIKVKILLLVIGSSLMGIGVVLSTVTELGADTVALLWDGMHIRFNISLGQANYMFTFFFFILVLLIDKKQIGIGTILSPLIQGVVMDIVIKFIPQFDHIFINVCVMVIGVFVLALGSGISAAADMGKSPYVGFTFAVNKKFNYSISIFRVVLDTSCLILGILLGAKLSIGPIVSVFIMGPITAWSCYKISRICNFEKTDTKRVDNF